MAAASAKKKIIPIVTKSIIAIFVTIVSMKAISASDVGRNMMPKYVVHAVKVRTFMAIASIVINTLISRQAAVAIVNGASLHGIVRTVVK